MFFKSLLAAVLAAASFGASADSTFSEVVGRIFAGDTGQPLAGFYVNLESGCVSDFTQPCEFQNTTTDENGIFSTSGVAGAATLSVSGPTGGPNYVPVSQSIAIQAGQNTSVVVYLDPGATITGTVTDAKTGEPVSFMTIGIYAAGQVYASPSLAPATDALGHYVATQIPAGTYTVSVIPGSTYLPQYFSARNLTPPSQGPQQADPVTVSAGATAANVDFALMPSGVLQGVITDKWTGKPIANSTSIFFYFSDAGSSGPAWLFRSASTDADGNYQISGLPESPLIIDVYGLDANRDYYSDEVIGCPAEPCYDYSQATVFTLTSGNTVSADIALFPANVITGTVTSKQTGAPIPGATVESYTYIGSTGYTQNRVLTDAQGHYVLPGTQYFSNDVYLKVSNAHLPDAGFFDQFYQNVDCSFPVCVGYLAENAVEPQYYSATSGVDFALDAAGSIVGQATAQGNPVALDVYLELYAANGTLIDAFFSEHDGSFSTEGLAPGTYYLAAYPPQGGNLNCVIYAGAPCSEVGDIASVATPIVVDSVAVSISVELRSDRIFAGDFE